MKPGLSGSPSVFGFGARFKEPGQTSAGFGRPRRTIRATLYNLSAFVKRRERHLGLNVLVYAGLSGFELVQVLRHISRGAS